MTDYGKRTDRTEEQSRTLANAATLLIEARRKAATMVRDSGAKLSPEERSWFGRPCGAALAPPPRPHFCGCNEYNGAGGQECSTRWTDMTGPDFGEPHGEQVCGHVESDHVEI